NQELVDELVSLSQAHGILTPYTSFLADENVNLSERRANALRASESAAMQLSVIDGAAAFHLREQKGQFQNAAQAQVIPELAPNVVRQVGQKAFFKKNRIWQDSTVTAEQA